MKELLFLVGGMAPVELLLNEMEKEIIKAKAELAEKKELSQETNGKLALLSSLIMTRMATNGDPKKTMEMIDEFEKTQKAKDLLSPSSH